MTTLLQTTERAARPHSPLLVPCTLALSVVLVNYRQWRLTARLVGQLRRSASFRRGASEVVVVDNHSPPHPLLPRLRRLEGVSLRRWGRNRGFARAVNEGVRLSRGDWVLLLNPDVSVPAGFLDRVEALTARLDRTEPRTGIVGLSLRDPDGTPQPSTGPFPTFLGTLARLLLPRRWRKYDLGRAPHERAADWVTGCCLLVRRRVLEELGGLDPAFFLYYEDVDLCRRARRLGWQVRHEPDIAVVHHHPLHGRPPSAYLRLLTRHALLTYAAHHWPAWQARWLARIVRVETWARGLLGRSTWLKRTRQIAEDMQHGRRGAARRRLDRAVALWERSADRHDGPVDCDPKLPARRPAAGLPDERAAPCPGRNAGDRRR